MPKAKAETSLRCFGTTISLLLLIVNIFGTVVLFAFGYFFLLRAYENVYFGIFSSIVVLSLVVPISAFARPNERSLIYALARRYWALVIIIAARGIFMTFEILNAQNTLIAQCQDARRIRQGSGAFFADCLVNSFSTCSDGMRIFVIVTITALSVDLFLHVAIFICARGLLNVYRNEPEETEQDIDRERPGDSFVKRMQSDAGNGTYRTAHDGRFQGPIFPAHPQRPFESYARKDQIYDSHRRPSIASTSHAVYTCPMQTIQAPYDTIQSAERRPSIRSQNGGRTGGFEDQRFGSEGPTFIQRKPSIPYSTCHGPPIGYALQHSSDLPERQQQIAMANICRRNSLCRDAYYSDTENFCSPNAAYFVTPIPGRDSPYAKPCQIRLVDSPVPMEYPTQTQSAVPTRGEFTSSKRNAMTENSFLNDIDDSHTGTLSDINNRGIQLVVTNPDLTAESNPNATRDEFLRGTDLDSHNDFSKREGRHDLVEVPTTQHGDDTRCTGSTTFAPELDEEVDEKFPSAVEGYTPRSYTEHSYRHEDDSEHFSDSSFQRRPYPFMKDRRSPNFETESLSNDRETDQTINSTFSEHPYDRKEMYRGNQQPMYLDTDSRDVHGEDVLPESLIKSAPPGPKRLGKQMFGYSDD